jgi:hypothetical protein
MPEPFFRLLTSEVMPLTVELATQFRDMKASPTERELDKSRVKHLKQKILAGQAVTFHWATAMLNGQELRMNGNHSSNALCQLNGSFPDGLMVCREKYEVNEEWALAYLFRQFDDRKSGRSPADVSGAYQGLYEPLREVPRLVAKLGVEGVIWYRREVEKVPVPNGDDMYSLFAETDLFTYLRWLGEFLDIGRKGKTLELAHNAVVAAMYATFIASETGARTFWSTVARGGVEFDDTAPATVLDCWLKEQRDNKDPRRKAGPGNFYQACVYAWAAFRQEEPIKSVKTDVKKGWHEVVR